MLTVVSGILGLTFGTSACALAMEALPLPDFRAPPHRLLDFDCCFDPYTFVDHRDRGHVSCPARRGYEQHLWSLYAMNNTRTLRCSVNVSSRSFFRTSIPTSFAIALVVLFASRRVVFSALNAAQREGSFERTLQVSGPVDLGGAHPFRRRSPCAQVRRDRDLHPRKDFRRRPLAGSAAARPRSSTKSNSILPSARTATTSATLST